MISNNFFYSHTMIILQSIRDRLQLKVVKHVRKNQKLTLCVLCEIAEQLRRTVLPISKIFIFGAVTVTLMVTGGLFPEPFDVSVIFGSPIDIQ